MYSLGIEKLGEPRGRAELVGAPRDAPCEVAGDGEPFGGFDGGSERLDPRPERSLAMERLPSSDRARDGDGVRAGVGHRDPVRGAEPFGIRAGRRSAG